MVLDTKPYYQYFRFEITSFDGPSYWILVVTIVVLILWQKKMNMKIRKRV